MLMHGAAERATFLERSGGGITVWFEISVTIAFEISRRYRFSRLGLGSEVLAKIAFTRTRQPETSDNRVVPRCTTSAQPGRCADGRGTSPAPHFVAPPWRRSRHTLADHLGLPRVAGHGSGDFILSPAFLLGRNRERKHSAVIHAADSSLARYDRYGLRLRATRPKWLEPLSPFRGCLGCGIDRAVLRSFRIPRRAFPAESGPCTVGSLPGESRA